MGYCIDVDIGIFVFTVNVHITGCISFSIKEIVVGSFCIERQQGADATSALMLDDGVIDPRDTRAVLGLCLTLCDESARRSVRPMQFGVARP